MSDLIRLIDGEGDTWEETEAGSGLYWPAVVGGAPNDPADHPLELSMAEIAERYGVREIDAPRTLRQHAAAISKALADAAADGYALYDEEDVEPVGSVLLCGLEGATAIDVPEVVTADSSDGEAIVITRESF